MSLSTLVHANIALSIQTREPALASIQSVACERAVSIIHKHLICSCLQQMRYHRSRSEVKTITSDPDCRERREFAQKMQFISSAIDRCSENREESVRALVAVVVLDDHRSGAVERDGVDVEPLWDFHRLGLVDRFLERSLDG